MIFYLVCFFLINSETQPLNFLKLQDQNSQPLELAIPPKLETNDESPYIEITPAFKEINVSKDKEKIIKENHVNSNKSKLKFLFPLFKFKI